MKEPFVPTFVIGESIGISSGDRVKLEERVRVLLSAILVPNRVLPASIVTVNLIYSDRFPDPIVNMRFQGNYHAFIPSSAEQVEENLEGRGAEFTYEGKRYRVEGTTI